MRKKRNTGVTISDEVRQQALEQFKSGKPLFGKGGAFAPMLQELLEAALEGELSAHLDDEEEEEPNRRNGHSSKQIKSSVGSFELSTPGTVMAVLARRSSKNGRPYWLIRLRTGF